MIQSVYKECNSTETVLIKVHNDITLNLDQGKPTAFPSILLITISLSNAFYLVRPVRHSARFSKCKDKELVFDRTSHFVWHSPGFCVGYLLFTLHNIPLSAVIQSHNLDHHLYAKDTQVYISLATSDASRPLSQLND